ncbi:solute carrier family 25 member 43-like [Tubulanus polymorphus]|uniref:solute carrier family 25 member 43-like n=1 Tax=Tubulanus polymorphus TaxID=672921 RepID=UPI003DA6055C
MISRSKKDHRLYMTQNWASGGIAGVVSRTFTAPLDVVKIQAQVGTENAKQGFIKTFVNIYRNEGLRAFWKGNLTGCLRMFPYSAIQFGTFQKMKLILANDQGRLSPFYAMMAGTVGGVVAVVTIYPTDLVKTRLIVQSEKKSYNGIVHAFQRIIRQEGIAALYKGVTASVLGVLPFAGASFVAYECLDRTWNKQKWMLTPFEHFINGSVAAAFAYTVSYPCDIVRKKLQAQSKSLPNDGGVDIKFKGMCNCFTQIIRINGVFGLWRGLTATLIRIVPHAGLMFVLYEATKRFFLYSNGFTESFVFDSPKPGVDQSFSPSELNDWKKMQRDIS